MRHTRLAPVTTLFVALTAALPLLLGCEAERQANAAPVMKTHTVRTNLFTAGDVKPGLEVTGTVSASCRRSVLSPENDLARRCFTNETSVALDPCFVPENPSPRTLRYDGVKTIALCLRDPHSRQVTKVYVLEDEPTVPRETVDQWWFLELADGTRCVKVIGAPVIREDLHLSYRCDNGYLYGIPDEEKRVWTIHHRLSDSEELVPAEVRTAWA